MSHTITRGYIKSFPAADAAADESNIEWRTCAAPDLASGTALVENTYYSVDPTHRIYLTDRESYLPRFKIGDVMPAYALGKVVASASDKLPVGSRVAGLGHWGTHSIMSVALGASVIADDADPQLALTLFNPIIGLTAYAGLKNACEVGRRRVENQPHCVVISGAAGAVGSIAGQVAKALGAEYVIGIAGGAQKCARLLELGYDAAIDYKIAQGDVGKLQAEVVAASARCGGVDSYFDNVGGWISTAVVESMKNFGSIALIGSITGYDQADSEGRISFPAWNVLLYKRIVVHPLICLDHLSLMADSCGLMGQLAREGKLRPPTLDVKVGTTAAIAQLKALTSGANTGKTVVKPTGIVRAEPLPPASQPADLPAKMKAVVNQVIDGKLVYGAAEVPTPVISDPNDIIVKVEAAPINPSDLGSVGLCAMLGGEVKPHGSSAVSVAIPEGAIGRVPSSPTVVGNEGCGIVVNAGSHPSAQALLGKRVAVLSRSTYAEYTKTTFDSPMFAVLPEGTSALQGASLFVNPLTVVGFLDTMRKEGHSGIVHTAAGSQLGRMLVKHCASEGVPLVNIVRSEEAASALKGLGAAHVVRSDVTSFKTDLVEALVATGATIGFDATGGGSLAGDILVAMEASAKKRGAPTSWYGTTVLKQVYKYGALDRSPTVLPAELGVGTFTFGGWLMPTHFGKYPHSHRAEAISKVVGALKDTFTTSYGKHLSLDDLGSRDTYLATLASKTDGKFLVCPNGALSE